MTLSVLVYWLIDFLSLFMHTLLKKKNFFILIFYIFTSLFLLLLIYIVLCDLCNYWMGKHTH